MRTAALSPASEAIIAEINAYHRSRMHDFEDRARRRQGSGPRLNLARTLMAMSHPGMLDGEDREALAEVARNAGTHFDLSRPLIPFSAMRDLTAAAAGAGGYLVSAETQEAVDILRPWSVSARAGVMLETGLRGDQVVPKVTAKSTPAWILTEGTQITPSQPTLAQIAMTPKNVGAVVNFSRQLAKQANAEAFVGRELMRSVGTALDQAIINGSGAAGQPTGLLGTAGIGIETGTSFAQAAAVSMKRKVADANAPDEEISFVGTPAVRELLEKRERATGLGFIWDEDRIASRPGRVSTDIPAATLICGAWSAIYVGIWGEGFVLEINPYDPTHFKTGVIQGRIIVSADVAVLHAAAFCKSESIT